MFSSTCAIKSPTVISEPRGCNYFNYDYNPFNDCCKQHNACYRSCTIPKPTCDSDYETCVHRVCGNMMDTIGNLQLTYSYLKWLSRALAGALTPYARIIFALEEILERSKGDINDLADDTNITCNLVGHFLMKRLSCEEFKSIRNQECKCCP